MKKINMASGKAFAALAVLAAAFAAAFTMASCSKEQLVEPENNTTPIEGNCIITAFTESSLNDNTTRTALKHNDETGNYDVVWSGDDKIKIGGNEFTLIEGAGTTTGKFQGTLPADGTHTAYYPATYNGTDWPNEQTYTEGNITGSPMKASVAVAGGKVSGPLSFTNAGGILRLTVKGTATIKAIKINAVGLNEITLNCGDGVKLDNTDGTVFHIAMPVGDYSGVSIYFRATDDNYCFKKLKEDTTLDIIKSQITPASFTVSFPSPMSADPLSGAFSIADGKQICFATGNLYYDGCFKFETKQYSFHATDFRTDTWGLFGWSTSLDNESPANNYGKSATSSDSNYSGYFYDWGKAISNTWRTLTSDEWNYLFEERKDASDKYGYASIGSVHGIIILPDEFTDPMKNNGNGAFQPQSLTVSKSWSNNYYTIGGNWEAMEAAGAVFLPAANRRIGEETKNEDSGLYWSSSACDNASKANFLFFNINSFNPDEQANRYEGHSVRLVANLASCTVKFDMNGKIGTAPESLKEIPYGSKITKPSDPSAMFYRFAGWYKDKDCTELWDFDSGFVTANITLYAGWIDLALSGEFSVSNNKKVYFSKGNLWYGPLTEGAGKTFNFEDNQYDFNQEVSAGNHLNWFMYAETADVSTYELKKSFNSYKPTYLFTNNPDDDTKPNSGFTAEGMTNVWRALSRDECDYLLFQRAMKHNGIPRYLFADKNTTITIDGQEYKGLFIYPDDYEGGLVGTSDLDTWKEIDSNSIVFLPMAGGMTPYTDTGDHPILRREMGYYVCSTGVINNYGYYSAYELYLNINYDVFIDYCGRWDNASSLRLVCDDSWDPFQ